VTATSRPTAVTVIGWLFVGGGVLTALGGVMGTVMSLLVPPAPRSAATTHLGQQAPFQILAYVTEHMLVFVGAQLLFGAVVAVCGFAMLRLRAWSRSVAEAITWLALAYILAFGTFWVWSVASMGLFNGPEHLRAFGLVFLFFGAIMCLAFAIPPIVIIRVLRGSAIREAFSGERA